MPQDARTGKRPRLERSRGAWRRCRQAPSALTTSAVLSTTALAPPSDHGPSGTRREKNQRGRLRRHQGIALVVDVDRRRTGWRISRRVARWRIADKDPVRIDQGHRTTCRVVARRVVVFHHRRLGTIVITVVVRLLPTAASSGEDGHSESDGQKSDPPCNKTP